MKVFWSWQSDTPGKTGRHFVRDALYAAINELKQPRDVEEPTEREIKDALHLDHDRKGVSGSPDLAPTILRKIDACSVFVADVTLVAEMLLANADKGPKKLINSNVAIEYGYALKAVSDESILMVQNTHYGSREELPFDLRHKAGPIQYCLAPDASKKDIEREGNALCRRLKEALEPYLSKQPVEVAEPFPETPTTQNVASFWHEGETVASSRVEYRRGEFEGSDHTFDVAQAFYLRLIPGTKLPDEIRRSELDAVTHQRRADLLVRASHSGFIGKNKFGSIIFAPRGESLIAFTQLFKNGEIWCVSNEFFVHYEGDVIIPVGNVGNIFGRVLTSTVRLASDGLKVPLPYYIELGAVGLQGKRLSLSRLNHYALSDLIYDNELRKRYIIDDLSGKTLDTIREDFVGRVYDLAAIA